MACCSHSHPIIIIVTTRQPDDNWQNLRKRNIVIVCSYPKWVLLSGVEWSGLEEFRSVLFSSVMT